MPWNCFGCSCLKAEVENVRELDYNHHSLKEVPADVFAHERTLEQLQLEANRITELPRALFHCHGLRVLNLSDNDIKVMPPAIASLINLQHLNLSKNSLSDIPDNIKCCKLLTYVNVSVNPLEKLPEGFTQLIALEELYLNDTFLEYLPANFGRLCKLRVLDLRENNLNTLPKSIARLGNLRLIDIGRNEFSDLPEVIGNLPEVTELWADSNKIRSIPPFIGNLVNLKHIDVSNNNIQWIAPEIQNCRRLNLLVLSSNELQSLPEEIGNLKELETLKLDDNDLEMLPASIGKLANLEELVVSQNVIEELPPTIGLLRKMKSINADDNRISDLPSELCSCSSLRMLSVRGNTLSSVPAEIGHLAGVRVINVADNLLRNLPVSVLSLTNLTALWLSTNQATPLTTLQQDVDPRTGQVVCTNFMFPQVDQDRVQSRREDYADRDPLLSAERPSRPHIRFADTADARHPSRLTRAPTPYPKELRSMAKHARILATRPTHPAAPDEDEDEGGEGGPPSPGEGHPLLGEMAPGLMDPRAVTIKMAKVTKQRVHQAEPDGGPDMPGIHHVVKYTAEPANHVELTSGDMYHVTHEPSAMGRVPPVSTAGTYLVAQHSANTADGCPTGFQPELIGDLQPVIYSDMITRSSREVARSGSPDHAPPTVPAEVLEDPPLLSTAGSYAREPHINGSFTPTFLPENNYSGAKVPPPYHIAAMHSKRASYFMNSCRNRAMPVLPSPPPDSSPGVAEVVTAVREISQAPLSPPPPPAVVTEVDDGDATDAGGDFSWEDPGDLSRIQEASTDAENSIPYAGDTTPPVAEAFDSSNGYAAPGEKEPSAAVSAAGAKCRIPVPKDSAVRSPPKAATPAGKAQPPHAAQHSGRPVTKIPSFRDAKTPPPRDTKSPLPRDTKSPLPRDTKSLLPRDLKSPLPRDTKSPPPPRQTNGTRIRQPGFHSSSQSPETAPQPGTGPVAAGDQLDGDGNTKASPDGHTSPDVHNANADGGLHFNSGDGLHFNYDVHANLDGQANGGENGKGPSAGDSPSNVSFKSRIPALSPGRHSPLWVFGQHKNPTVFPVMIVKNPGLGFSIGGGAGASTENPGIFISKVHPGGPASSFLHAGDKILEVDGIDFLKLEHDQAVGILKQTKGVVNMMISRQK